MAANIFEFPSADKPVPPAPKKASGKKKYYDLIITLEDSNPEIWREIIVPTDFPLDFLHDVMMALFDWSGDHMYFFERPAKKTFYDDPRAPEGGFGYPAGEKHVLADQATVRDLLPKKGSHAKYVYDLGDYWEFDLFAFDSLDEGMIPFRLMPVCIDGAEPSPLEDVGGVGGWNRFLDIMSNPHDPQYEEMLEWSGCESAADALSGGFVPREVNAEIAYMASGAAFADTLPDDVELLKEMIAQLAADNLALETDAVLIVSNMSAAFDQLRDMGFPNNLDD